MAPGRRSEGEDLAVKLAIEVEWDPITLVSEDPNLCVFHAHREVEAGAQELVKRLRAIQGHAKVTMMRVEDDDA